MIESCTTRVSTNRFFKEVIVSQPDDGLAPYEQDSDLVRSVVASTLADLGPQISTAEESSEAACCIPVFMGQKLTSLVTFLINGVRDPGVMEIWKPVGEYEELSLASGFFGELDRFQNVSSFVRFEKGAGLPGQVWAKAHPVIHDNLAQHSGFLRAAGASAEALSAAIGLPIFASNFLATLVLISSDASPIAGAIEVWNRSDNCFELGTATYATEIESKFQLTPGSNCPFEGQILNPLEEYGRAVLVEDLSLVGPSRLDLPEQFQNTLLIPSFVDGQLQSITSFIL
ncbi:MAG: GAF domain-containing protein [Planctomycetota bacterium]